MYEISNRTATPYSSVVYIESGWADGTATRASGVLVGYNDVLTALHAVYDSNHGGWASRVTVIPGADTSPWNQPYGEATNFGQLAGRAPNWDMNGDGFLSQAESAGDMALIGMRSRIGDIPGWLPVAQQPNDFYGIMAGYPSRGTGLMAEDVFVDASATDSVYNINAGLGAGASGGPLLDTSSGRATVVGVLSGGDYNNTSSTYAGLFSADTWNWLHGAMAANDALLSTQVPTSGPGGGMVLNGGPGDNYLLGGGGWDLFTGGGGNDTIEAGAGTDTAVFSGARETYATAVNGTTITVADTFAGRDGHDTLRDVERLKFAGNVCVAFDTAGCAGQAYRLYQAAFDRSPDTGGLGYWITTLDKGAGLTPVAQSFVGSAEFSTRYGSLNNDQFVNQLYLNVLDRGGDAGGLAYWTGHLNANHLVRAEVLVYFSESPENQAALIGVIQNGMVYTA